jgi:uncharacterized protein YbjT (DUF2867 family)
MGSVAVGGEGTSMQITVLGASSLLGGRVVQALSRLGHDVAACTATSGVDPINARGLEGALDGADVVVDLLDPPESSQGPATWYLATSTAHVLSCERRVGVSHHFSLSILGAERVQTGYFAAKTLQERRIRESGIPHTILRTSIYFEQIHDLAAAGARDGTIELPLVWVQPVAADDVVDAIARRATNSPTNRLYELAGPERQRLPELAHRVLAVSRDDREVVGSPEAQFLGAFFARDSDLLLPTLHRTATGLDTWIHTQSDAARRGE